MTVERAVRLILDAMAPVGVSVCQLDVDAVPEPPLLVFWVVSETETMALDGPTGLWRAEVALDAAAGSFGGIVEIAAALGSGVPALSGWTIAEDGDSSAMLLESARLEKAAPDERMSANRQFVRTYRMILNYQFIAAPADGASMEGSE